MDILKNKNKILAVILIVLVVIIAIAGIALFNQNTLTQTNDTWTQEAGQKLELKASDFFDVDESKAEQITFDVSEVDADTVGEYTATAFFKEKTFDIKVNVVDTTAPMVEFASRVLFTNDIKNADCTACFEGIYDASEYTAKLVRFEYSSVLDVMDENAVADLTASIPIPCDAEELKALGTEELPTEPGVYRAVMEIADVHGNAVLEEVYVVYDTTGALIEDVPDRIIEAASEDLDKEPTINKNDYTITDNVDGVIDADNITCELELRDADNHEWLVHISYTDRAGNESKADFLITVEETKAVENDNHADSSVGDTSDADNTNNDTTTDTTSTTPTMAPEDTTTYDPADADRDGVVTSEEAAANISVYEQMAIDAGYGNVVQIDTNAYAVLTHGDGLVNGQNGGEYLINYLANLGLQAQHVSGGWIDSDKDWYWITAEGVTAIDTSGDDW